MNLNKIEKIFIIVLVVGVIVGVGIAMFIMPAKDKIDAAESRLVTLQKEEEDLNAKLAREATIDKEIEDAKKSAEELEGTFYPDLTTYEAVEIVLAHLEKCKLSTLAIEADLLTTKELALEVYEEEPVIYDLKTFSQSAKGIDENAVSEGQFKDKDKVYTITVTSITDIKITDENGTEIEKKNYTDTMKKAYKHALCEFASSTQVKQTVSVLNVSCEVYGTYGDYLKFIDYIYDLDRATYMDSVIFPMTYDVEKEADEVNSAAPATVEELINTETVYAEDDILREPIPVNILFFGVEQMEELETIDASGVKIVVNQ